MCRSELTCAVSPRNCRNALDRVLSSDPRSARAVLCAAVTVSRLSMSVTGGGVVGGSVAPGGPDVLAKASKCATRSGTCEVGMMAAACSRGGAVAAGGGWVASASASRVALGRSATSRAALGRPEGAPSSSSTLNASKVGAVFFPLPLPRRRSDGVAGCVAGVSNVGGV